MSAGRVIMVVEDNPRDVELTLRALRKCQVPYPVVVAHDGAEALDYLLARGAHAERDPADLPWVVLLDLKLPKIDGMEVLTALRANERTRLLPVVVLTSSVQEQDLVRSYGLGASSYVRKPVESAQFVEAVRQLGVYWSVLNVPPRSGGP
ncbi:MAG: response regulator [Polyangiales bacterium]